MSEPVARARRRRVTNGVIVRPVRRVLITLAAAFAAGILGAVGLAIIDLYMTGHGLGSLTRETITWDPGDVHMSPADVILLAWILAAAMLAWRLAKGKRDGA